MADGIMQCVSHLDLPTAARATPQSVSRGAYITGSGRYVAITLSLNSLRLKRLRVGAAAARQSPLHPACSRQETSRIAQPHEPMPPQMPDRCPGPDSPTTSPG